MPRPGAIAATAILFTFLLMAASVVCLASGAASAMNDCGSEGSAMGTAALCPFMSVSVPAVASVMRVFGVVAVLIGTAAAALWFFLADRYAENFFMFMRQRRRDFPDAAHADVVLNLISDGILHARVFGL